MSRVRNRLTHRLSVGKAFHAFWKLLMQQTQPFTIGITADSTSNGTTDWFYLAMAWLGTRFPAYTVTHYLWSDTDQAYETPTYLQIGTAGDRYATFGSEVSKGAYTASHADYNVTDLDVRVFLTSADYTPAGSGILCGRESNDPNRQWWIEISGSGVLYLYWFPTGSYASAITAGSTAAVTTRVSDGARIGIRATLDVDNGSEHYEVKFYTSTDSGGTWAQLGNTVTGASTTALAAVTAPVTCGGRGAAGIGSGFNANYHAFELMDSINGKTLAYFDVDAMVTTPMTDIAGRSWTFTSGTTTGGSPGLILVNGSHPGASFAYVNDGTRYPKLTPAMGGVRLWFVNFGHNDAASPSYSTDYDTLASALAVSYASATIVPVAQNPEDSAAANYEAHNAKQSTTLPAYAASEGLPLLDAYSRFVAVIGWETDLVGEGGVHPTAAGYVLWANAAKAFLERL